MAIRSGSLIVLSLRQDCVANRARMGETAFARGSSPKRSAGRGPWMGISKIIFLAFDAQLAPQSWPRLAGHPRRCVLTREEAPNGRDLPGQSRGCPGRA